jgi:2-oxoglutarate ferredoxin oxidoreductase subunit delta
VLVRPIHLLESTQAGVATMRLSHAKADSVARHSSEMLMSDNRDNSSPKKGVILIDNERCKGCGLCVAVCERGVIKVSDSFNSKGYAPVTTSMPERCTGCGICALMCPDVAITVLRRTRQKQDEACA